MKTQFNLKYTLIIFVVVLTTLIISLKAGAEQKTWVGDITNPDQQGNCPAGYFFNDQNNNGIKENGECWAGVQIKDGNVGIGKTTPEAALDVNGSIRTGAGQNFKIRYGSVMSNVTVPGGGYQQWVAYISFGYTFSSPPVVFITNNQWTWDYSGPDVYITPCAAISTTGAWLCGRNLTNYDKSLHHISWLAIGE